MSDSLWRPSAVLETLRARATLLANIRSFFAERNVLEVETPTLSAAGTTDPNIESFVSCCSGFINGDTVNTHPLYLTTSPEFHMKRLLAAGSGPIYQISRAFRNNESGQLHNPEFSLLEWYQPGYDYHQLMQEVAELLHFTLQHKQYQHPTSYQAAEYICYRDLFQNILCIDPMLDDKSTLIDCARANGIDVVGMEAADRDAWLDLLMSHCIQPKLSETNAQTNSSKESAPKLIFVYDYPASQASLARIRDDDPPVAERFELFVDGIEIANGFCELQNSDEQLQRFNQDNARRQQAQQNQVVVDMHLISALKHGLPDCSGVALGVDRLLKIMLGTKTLQDCLAFSFDRA